MDRQIELGRGRFDGRDEFEIIVERLDRRHEDAQAAVAHFDGERSAHRESRFVEHRDGARGRCITKVSGASGGDAIAPPRDAGKTPRPDRMRDARIGQRQAFGERIGRHQMRIIGRGDIGQRLQRQAEAERRIAGHQEQPAAARAPDFAQPSRLRLRGPALQRQHKAFRLAEMTVEQFQDARALVRIVDLGIARIEIVRDQALLEHPVDRILISGLHVIGHDSRARGNTFGKALRIVGRRGALGGVRA